jgi:hypothetical protein
MWPAVAAVLLSAVSTASASADVKSFKGFAIVKCESGSVYLGHNRFKGQGNEDMVLSTQDLMDQLYDETVKQMTAAGVKFADTKALSKAAADFSGQTAHQEEQAAKQDAKMKEMQAQMANLPPGVADMMKGGMMGSGGMGSMLKNRINAKNKAAAEGDSGGASSASGKVGTIGGLYSSVEGAAPTRKSKDPKAAKFFQALDQAGADGFVILDPTLELYDGHEASVFLEAKFFDADGKRVRWADSGVLMKKNIMVDIKGERKGRFTHEQAKAAYQEAIPQAVATLVKNLEK